MHIVLKRVDSEESIDRWYSIDVQPTLFEPFSVICAWGSRQTNWFQMRIISANNADEAVNLARRIEKQKLKRGYVVLEKRNIKPT